MKIYPKTSSMLEGYESLKFQIIESGGVEIQYFHDDGKWGNFDIAAPIEKILNEDIGIKEITIHPPLLDYDIELVLQKDKNIIIKQIDVIKKLVEKYNVKINLLYHTEWSKLKWEQGLIDQLEDILKYVKDSRIIILLENIHTLHEFKECTALDVCKKIDNENLRMCLDVCHVHCMCNIFNFEYEEFVDRYLNKEDASKYIYQIHFSDTKNNDGYKEKNTHGRKHDNLEDLKRDYEILKKLGIENKNIITEVAEEDYKSRKNQIFEIELLKKCK